MHFVDFAVFTCEVGGDEVCHYQLFASGVDGDVAVARRDQDFVSGMCGEEDYIGVIAALEEIVGGACKDLIHFGIRHSRRVVRVVVTFGFGVLTVEDAGRDDGDIVSEMVPLQPGVIPVGFPEVTVHVVERGLRVGCYGTGEDVCHVGDGADPRFRKCA